MAAAPYTVDLIKRLPAERCPHWVMATLHGVPEWPDDPFSDIAAEKAAEVLHARNRAFWNRWVGSTLNFGQRRRLIEDAGFPAAEFEDLGKDEQAWALEQLRRRAGWTRGVLPDPNQAIFRRVRFDRKIKFSRFVFRDSAFQESTFLNNAHFRSAQFIGFFDLSSAKFLMSSYFDKAIFNGSASFLNARFFKNANFTESCFSNGVIFQETHFYVDAVFNSVQFPGYAHFREVYFFGYASFNQTQFSRNADFKEAQFTDEADFKGATFSRSLSFRSATFGRRIAAFPGASFPDDVSFQDIKLPPKPPADEDGLGDEIEAYEKLKREMGKINRHEDELRFLAKELVHRLTQRMQGTG